MRGGIVPDGRAAGGAAILSAVTSPRSQPTTTWNDAGTALRRLLEAVRAEAEDGRPLIVGITGPVGSGKTSLAARLLAPVRGTLLSTDHYLPDYDSLPEHERDDPRHADLPLLAEHLAALRRAEPIDRPVWSFHSHSRVGVERVEPAPLIACEGIFALHPAVRAAIDLAVFVDAPAGVRWRRWERLEVSGERGWGVEHARRYFATVAEPTFDRYAEAYKASADLVVINDGDSAGGPSQDEM